MENKLLKELYDYFYVRPELDEQENEVEECHKALIAALEKPETKILSDHRSQNYITEQTSLDSFIAGFECWKLSNRNTPKMTKTSADSPVGPENGR